jgi:hypothetical protein
MQKIKNKKKVWALKTCSPGLGKSTLRNLNNLSPSKNLSVHTADIITALKE